MGRYDRFLEQVIAAASRRKKTRRPLTERDLEQLAEMRAKCGDGGVRAMWRAPRCSAKNRAGKRCGAPAMRGTDRCAQHGGRLRVPEHPSNIRRLPKLLRGRELQRIRKERVAMLQHLTIQERRVLANVLGPEARFEDEYWGAFALLLARKDDGVAWRKWLNDRKPMEAGLHPIPPPREGEEVWAEPERA